MIDFAKSAKSGIISRLITRRPAEERPLPMQLSARKIIYLLVIIVFARYIYLYRDQLFNIAQVIRSGVWYWVGAAGGVFALIVINQGATYGSIYRLLHLPQERKQLSRLFLATRFVSVAAPSGGLSGMVPFIHDARRNRMAIGPVLLANVLYLVLWYSAFAVFLFAGLLHLFIIHDLEWFEIVEAAILLAVDVVFIGGLLLAWSRPNQLTAVLHKLVHWATAVAHRLRRQPPLSLAQVDKFSHDLVEAMAKIHHATREEIGRPILHAFLNELLNLTTLYLIALAFHTRLSFGVLVATYSISSLFYLISPTPGGLGIVEGIMVVVMTGLGIKADAASVITLAYRGFTFWLPFLLGFVMLRRLKLDQPATATTPDEVIIPVTSPIEAKGVKHEA